MKSQLTGGGVKAITASGTAEALSATHIFARELVLQALETNTAQMIIGHADTVTHAAKDGVIITALNVLSLKDVFLDEVFLDAETSGEGVSFMYSQQRSLN